MTKWPEKYTSPRKKAGLSQRQLAELVGTTASVICLLEDADYQGHSLSMLRRIASALTGESKSDLSRSGKPIGQDQLGANRYHPLAWIAHRRLEKRASRRI